MDEALLQAKLEAVEARTETKFAQLLGELKVIGERIGSLDGKIVSLDSRVSSLDGKIEAVDLHTRAGKRDILIAVVGASIAVAALAALSAVV